MIDKEKEAFNKWRNSKGPLNVNDAWYTDAIWDFVWGLSWEAFKEGERFAYANRASDGESLQRMAEGSTLDLPGLTEWEATLIYKHLAFKQVRHEKLDILLAHCYSEAFEFATAAGQKVMDAKFPKENMQQIESWTVKVRPAKS
jgi:hypothetical protein